MLRRRLPLVVLSTLDPVLRDSVVAGAVMDDPRTVVLRHDIVSDGETGSLRRVVLDGQGVVEDVLVPLEHACLSCAVREDVIPTLRRLAGDGRWTSVLLGLPVSAESLPAARALHAQMQLGGALAALRLSAVATAVDVEAFEANLLGDDLLVDRQLALAEDDERAVGEALAAQVEHADVIVVAGDPGRNPVGADLLEHLRAADSRRVDGLHGFAMGELLSRSHDLRTAEGRMNPNDMPDRTGPAAHGVWTITLQTERPFHPERLLDRIEELACGRVRGRGVFWVPTRPDSACAWDGVGGQLSIGELGPWGTRPPRTRLILTGTGPQASLRSAFEDVVLTDEEHRRGLAVWLGQTDVLGPWLGDRSSL